MALLTKFVVVSILSSEFQCDCEGAKGPAKCKLAISIVLSKERCTEEIHVIKVIFRCQAHLNNDAVLYIFDPLCPVIILPVLEHAIINLLPA